MMPQVTCVDSRFAAAARSERVVLVMDHSISMDTNDYPPSRLSAAIQSCISFVNKKEERHADDRVGVVTFCEYATVVHPVVAVRNGASSLRKALRAVSSGPGTDIAAGLREAARLLDTAGPSRRGWLARLLATETALAEVTSPQKRVILLSDGFHLMSPNREPRSVAGSLKHDGTIIEVIGIGGSPQDVDEVLLKQIASKDCNQIPRYTFIGDAGGLIRKFESMSNRLRRRGA